VLATCRKQKKKKAFRNYAFLANDLEKLLSNATKMLKTSFGEP
jgi:hypothetical protein